MERKEMMELRPYQKDCIDALVKYRRTPVEGGIGARALVAMATGCGKTVIFSQLPRWAKKRVLVVAHREELLDQAVGHLESANPGKTVGVEQADRHAGDADIVVASIQTLTHGSAERLKALKPDEFSLIIVDEAHHATARTYIELLHHFGLAPDVSDMGSVDLARKIMSKELRDTFDNYRPSKDGPFLVGFTATPHRTDGQGMEIVFDQIAFSATMDDMIRQGWLCPIRGVKVDTGHDITKVKSRMGDYAETSLAEVVNTPQRNRLAANTYLANADGRQAIIFCVNVEHTIDMAAAWNDLGISTAVVTGETPRDERREILRKYQAREIRALSNCMVLTEGFDAPDTSCIVMARPTKSGLIYTQAMGRGTRISPNKEDLLVLDLVDMAAKGAVVQTTNTLFGLPAKLDISEMDAVSARDAMAEILDAQMIPISEADEIESLEDLPVIVREYNPLAAARFDSNLSDAHLSWIKTSYGYTCNLMGEGQMGIVIDLLGHAEVHVQLAGETTRILSDDCSDVADAIQFAENWVENEVPQVISAVSKNARWHGDDATEKQVNLLHRLGVKDLAENITKGMASALIEQAKAKPENQRRLQAWADHGR